MQSPHIMVQISRGHIGINAEMFENLFVEVTANGNETVIA